MDWTFFGRLVLWQTGRVSGETREKNGINPQMVSCPPRSVRGNQCGLQNKKCLMVPNTGFQPASMWSFRMRPSTEHKKQVVWFLNAQSGTTVCISKCKCRCFLLQCHVWYVLQLFPSIPAAWTQLWGGSHLHGNSNISKLALGLWWVQSCTRNYGKGNKKVFLSHLQYRHGDSACRAERHQSLELFEC